jgi:hypothetical protein
MRAFRSLEEALVDLLVAQQARPDPKWVLRIEIDSGRNRTSESGPGEPFGRIVEDRPYRAGDRSLKNFCRPFVRHRRQLFEPMRDSDQLRTEKCAHRHFGLATKTRGFLAVLIGDRWLQHIVRPLASTTM